MNLDEIVNAVEVVSNVGIPLIVTIGLLVFLFNVCKYLPKKVDEFFENFKARDKLYDDQMRIITVVAQQGVEAQRRGNEIIERNNIIMQERSVQDANLAQIIRQLMEQSKRTEDTTLGNRAIAQSALNEAVRASERLSALKD